MRRLASLYMIFLPALVQIVPHATAARAGSDAHIPDRVHEALHARAILISGDGAWGDIERDLAAGFKVQRMSVTVIDSSIDFATATSVSKIALTIDNSETDRCWVK
jgi:hypothetical protein